MRTALDMAQRLHQQSLRTIASVVAAADFGTPIFPLSLREILKLFAKMAKPETPNHLQPDGGTYSYQPGLRMHWADAGAGTYRFATRFHFRLQRQFGGPPPVNDMDEWTTGTEMVHA